MNALLKAREKQAQLVLVQRERDNQACALSDVPADAQFLEPEATVHVWDGGKFVPYGQWLVGAVCAIGPPAAPAITVAADSVVGICGGVHIRLVREHGRWLMFVKTGDGKRATRRTDFASPSLLHGIATAKQWYGAARDGWHAQKANADETKDLPSPNPTANEEWLGEKGLDDLALDGK